MLITKEVEIKWHNKIRGHYELKGYMYTKNGDKLIVKTEDLPKSSHIRIDYRCNNCGEVINTSYKSYNRCNDDLCRPCATKIKTAEKLKMPFDAVKNTFENKGYTLISTKEEYINAHSMLTYLCPSHGLHNITYGDLRNGYGCMECSIEQRSRENNYNWQGGVTELNKHLRQTISPWISDSMKQCNFKCILTKEKKWHVHHITSFNKIVFETLEYLKLSVKPIIGDYTEQEITLINNKCLQLHYEYGLGVCVREDLHTLFHCNYGYGDNTVEQWEEFVFRYKAGEFDE